MDTDNPSSSDLTMAPPSAPLATTSTITTTPSSSHTTINSSTAPPSRALLPQPGSSSSATRSPPRLPTTAAIISTIDPRSGSSTPTQQGQNLSPQRSSSLSPRFRELREPAASSSGSSSSSSGSSGVYGSGQSNGVLDAKPSSQLALMLSTALEELDTLKSRHTEEKRRADYWEGLARSFKVVEEAYSMGSSSGSSGSPGHDRSPRVSTISGSSQHHTSDYPPAIVELVSSLHQARYNAECARDDEHARRIVITDLWRQLRDYLDVLERHARDAKLAFDRRAVGLDSGEPIDSDRRETTAGGILVETQRPIPSLRDFEGAGFVYDEKGRLVNRSGQPLPVGVEPIFKYRGERAPETSPFANTVMGPPTLPPFTAASESRTHRKRRSGSVEGSHHGHTGHVHKRSRVNSYLPPPQPIHPPSHPTQPFNLPPNSSSAPNHQNHSPLPSHSTRRSPPLQIPPPPPPQQHFGEVRPQSKGQGQFVPWHPPGHPSSSKQPPPPQQASYPTFNARDLERERQDRERGRPSSLPHESRDRSERGRDRSRSVSSDKSLDDMILDATAPSDQPDQSDISGNQLPPLRYTSSSGVGNGSTKRRSSRERDEREREYHQRRSPPPPHHYLPPPGGPKMYTHPPPPLPPYQNREVFAPGEGRSGDRLEGVVRAGENGQGGGYSYSKFRIQC
ncbi:hypothetical protein L218DRAFT_82627 [Marasmius fiardii PR-910]|nr:hypothetical protein L218DRAFT_82627 [Marasmius fiardii PR-910]